MDTSYLRDVLTVSADIRGMVNEALSQPDETGQMLELIRNAADQLYSAASDRLREAERAEWHAMLHEK